jgi:hypothetical protein
MTKSKHDSGNDGNDSGDEKLQWGDSRHDGDEGVTPRISKCAECDSSDKHYQKRNSGNYGKQGVTP